MKTATKINNVLEAAMYGNMASKLGQDYPTKLDNSDKKILIDTLAKKYKNDKGMDIEFKAYPKGINVKVDVKDPKGDLTNGRKSEILKELENEIMGIISKWEKDNA